MDVTEEGIGIAGILGAKLEGDFAGVDSTLPAELVIELFWGELFDGGRARWGELFTPLGVQWGDERDDEKKGFHAMGFQW